MAGVEAAAPSDGPHGAQMLQFSTAAYRAQERVTAWREAFGRTLLNIDIAPRSPEDFRAEATLYLSPTLGLMRAATSPVDQGNSPGLITNDNLTFGWVLAERWTAAQLGRQAELEEVELGVMERLEAHTAALDELETANAEVERQQVAAEADRDAAFAALDDEATQVRAERAAAANGLDAGLVTLYEKLRGQLSGRGAAALVGRQCQGCRMELNPVDLDAIRAAPPEQVVRCEECGRILVRTDQ